MLIKPDGVDDDELVRTPSGLILPASVAQRRYFPKKPLAMDFFCGAGGFSLGLEAAGFDVFAASDNDYNATLTYTLNLGAYPMQFVWITPEDEERFEAQMQKDWVNKDGTLNEHFRTTGSAYRRNHPEMQGCRYFFFGDICKMTGEEICKTIGVKVGELDLICGSPPCQGFSVAGRRNIADPRNDLTLEFARIVVEMRPKTMVFENVPGILNMVRPDGQPVMDAFIEVLEAGHYGNRRIWEKAFKTQFPDALALRAPTGRSAKADPDGAKKRPSRKKSKARHNPAAPSLFDHIEGETDHDQTE